MNDSMWLITIGGIALGVYLTHLINKVKDLEEQVESYHEMVIEMAKELQALGSDNVRIYQENDNE